MNLVPSRYERRSMIAQTTARNSRRVVYKFRFWSFLIIHQYVIGFSTLSYRICYSTYHNWQSHASVLRVYRPSFLGRPDTGGEIVYSCKVRKAVSFSLFRCSSSFSCNPRSLTVNEDEMRENFGTNRWNIL